VKNTSGTDLANDKIAMQRLRDAAEQAKKELSTATSTNISLQYLSMSENGPIHLDESLTRAQFEQLTADLLHAPSQGAASPLSMPSVAARLAAACQSSLLGRTLAQYGGVVQSITDAAPPYRLLSVSTGWQSLTGYHREEVLGRSMGFLQGPRTQRPAIAALMEAVLTETPVSVRLTN
jgi:hypothetical protein